MKRLDYEVIVPRRSVHENVQIDLWCTKQWGLRWDPIDNREGHWAVFWAGPKIRPSSFRWRFDTQERANWFALKWL
jgi:hypothetical protein